MALRGHLALAVATGETGADQPLACQAAPDLYFAESPADVEAAKRLCHDCSVKADCLTGAMARAEPWGVWGGELLADGVIVPRKRARGRPRKDEAA
jgi:WhiB family redox-sensing transcriptional regulator